MQITLNIPDALAAEAEARGVTIDSYILAKLAGTESRAETGKRTVGEVIDRIRELRKGNRLDGLKIKDLIDEGRRF